MKPLNILDKTGKVIHSSKNLRGIRDHVSQHMVKVVSVGHLPDGEGKLCVLFVNGDSFECNFASYEVLVGFVRRWRNIRGAEILFQ